MNVTFRAHHKAPQFSATLEQKRAAREMLMDTVIKHLPKANDMVN